ncbi:MAG: VOC family protein [Clostridium sp.]
MLTNHIGIKVRNIQEAEKFYCENLEFKLEHRYDDDKRTLVFLENASTVIELIYVKTLEYSSVANGIVEHIAFTVENIEEYAEKLRDNGVEFSTCHPMELDEKLVIFFQGPNGEKLELVQHLR